MFGREYSKLVYNDAETATRIVFDDFEIEEDDDGNPSAWTEICPRCKKKYFGSLAKRASFDEGAANGTCCVVGCWEKADDYIDFNINDVSFLM